MRYLSLLPRRFARLSGVAGGLIVLGLQHPAGAQLTMLSPAQQDAGLAEVAAEAARRGAIAPVPLVGEESRALGAYYDRFHIGVLIARAQMAATTATDAAAIAAHPAFRSRGTVVVAYPISCDGRPNRPLAIRVAAAGGQIPSMQTVVGESVRGVAANALLPGATLPDESLLQSFRNIAPTSMVVEIDYSGPVCRGGATTARLALTTVSSPAVRAPFSGVKPPADLASLPMPATVRMQALLDASGRVRFPNQVQGPVELASAAIALLESRSFEPTTINGVAVPQWVLAPVVFSASGEPAGAEPFVPPGFAPGTVVRVTNLEMISTMPPPGSTPLPPAPPVPAGLFDSQLARLAVETAQSGKPVPISMDPAGPPVHGVIFDRFLMGVVHARAAIASGSPIDPAAAPQSLVQGDLIAVAFPLVCDGNRVAATDVLVSSTRGTVGLLPSRSSVLTGAALADRLPGVALPGGAIGRVMRNASPNDEISVQITYAGRACPGDSNTATLPIQWVRGVSMPRMSTLKLPDTAASLTSPAAVRVRGLIDLEGKFRFPTMADGPPELAAAALAAAATWRFQPYRANGVPMPQFLIAPLWFTTTGAPAPPPVGGPPVAPAPAFPPQPPPGSTPASPPIMTNSTTGGRSSTDFTTRDVEGLTIATSKCAVAEDDTYGFSPADAIKVGGGSREGPALERRYLAALRGPTGQGMRAVRLGSVMAPDKKTILDLYELTYAGLAQPLRLYLDEYHTETLKAPKGLVCAG